MKALGCIAAALALLTISVHGPEWSQGLSAWALVLLLAYVVISGLRATRRPRRTETVILMTSHRRRRGRALTATTPDQGNGE